MEIQTEKIVIIYLDSDEAKVLRLLFGNMSFNSYLNILNDKEYAEIAQNLGAEIFDTLESEGF